VNDRVVRDSSEKRVADPLICKPPQKIRSDLARISIHHLYFSTDAVVHIMRTTRHVANFQSNQFKGTTLTRGFRVLKGSSRVAL
jgi:hypothetical protein